MADGKALAEAKRNKKDEFYTQYDDIQNELNHYTKHFEGKTVLCNCDDPYESNFCKFFLRNFKYLKLKRLICTSYTDSCVIGTQMSLFDNNNEPLTPAYGYVMDVNDVPMANGRGVTDEDIDKYLHSDACNIQKLQGSGDFASPECVEYLMQADIVVTNPPFSKFRDYVALLMEYDKKFLILGNKNAITYKEIFPLIKDGKIWLGASIHSGSLEFRIPKTYNEAKNPKNYRYDEFGNKYTRTSGPRWFTNLDYPQRHEDLILYEHYSPEKYPKYDNYDAIEVSKTREIPDDFADPMGVPITFLDKYNPEQFEILGITDRQNTSGLRTKKYTEEDSSKYNDLNARSVILKNGQYHAVYARILIRNKHPKPPAYTLQDPFPKDT